MFEPKLVGDQPYAGVDPKFFMIKRKSRGEKWEIKDKNKKKFLEVQKENMVKQFMLHNENLKVGKFVELSSYTLQNTKKSNFGVISQVFNYPQERDLSYRVKNSSGYNLITFQYQTMWPQYRSYSTKEQINKLYQIESGSGSFHLDVTQELIGRISKRNIVLNINILNSRDEICLSIIKKKNKDDQFEAILYQGISPLVAISLVVLLAGSIWPPKPKL